MVFPSFLFLFTFCSLGAHIFFLLTKKRERGNKGEGVEREKKTSARSRVAPLEISDQHVER